MGIINFLNHEKLNRKQSTVERVKLARPMINIFLGSELENERMWLLDFFDKRIGSGPKVRYADFIFGAEHGINEYDRFSQITMVSRVDGSYSLTCKDEDERELLSSEKLETLLIDYSKDIFNKVTTGGYAASGEILLSVFLKSDSTESSIVEPFLITLKKAFAGIYTVRLDVYCLLDQREYSSVEKGDERKASNYLTTRTLEYLCEQKKIDMFYVLSNLNSKDILNLEGVKEQIEAAGLMILLKNGVSDKRQERNEMYSDADFRANCDLYSGSNGYVYSLGHLKLEMFQDAIRYVAYKSVLMNMVQKKRHADVVREREQLSLTKDTINSIIYQSSEEKSFSRDVIVSIVRSKEFAQGSINHQNRREILTNIYGRNLEYFYDKNKPVIDMSIVDESSSALLSSTIDKLESFISSGIYSLHDVTKMLNEIMFQIELEIKAEKDSETAVMQNLNIWLNSKETNYNVKDVDKETKILTVIIKMASDFLEQQLKCDVIRMRISVYEKLKSKFSRMTAGFSNAEKIIIDAIDELKNTIESSTENELELLVGNLDNYYSRITNDIIRSDSSFSNLENKIIKEAFEKQLDPNSLYKYVVSYCEEHIMNEKMFNQNFTEEISNRLMNYENFTTENEIFDFAFNTILGTQKFYINYLVSEEINKEVAFFINSNNSFVDQKNTVIDSLRARRQMKLFYEKSYQDIDVLYILGRFSTHQISGYSSWLNAYERLKN
jgi:hypothetical protein